MDEILSRAAAIFAAFLLSAGVCMIIGFWPVVLIVDGARVLYWAVSRVA